MAAEKEKEQTPKNLPDLFSELLNRKKGPNTPSEILVRTARDRDILYDMINHKKCELENSPDMDDEEKKFTEDYIAALSGAKDILTARIKSLLDKT